MENTMLKWKREKKPSINAKEGKKGENRCNK